MCHLIGCQEATNLGALQHSAVTEAFCSAIGTHLLALLFEVIHTVLTHLLPHSLQARRTNCPLWLPFRSSTARKESWLSRNTRNRHIKIHHFGLLTCYHWVWHTLSQKVAPGENSADWLSEITDKKYLRHRKSPPDASLSLWRSGAEKKGWSTTWHIGWNK